jgi:hypothetical protein
MTTSRTCIVCGKPLGNDPRALYCSHACRTKAYKNRERDKRLAAMRRTDIDTDKGIICVTDEEVARLFVEAAFMAGELNRASISGRESLQPACSRLANAITEVLKTEGVLHD